MADQPTTPTAETQTPEAQPAPAPREMPEGKDFFLGTGRRKTAVARVRIRPGSGKFLINGREIDAFFSEPQDRNDMTAPLEATNTLGSLEVIARVTGGGTTGQAGAVLLALSRALKAYDESLEPALRSNGFLTTDDRQVERKKYGQRGARRRFQFSKR